jgi:hypothetical protein
MFVDGHFAAAVLFSLSLLGAECMPRYLQEFGLGYVTVEERSQPPARFTEVPCVLHRSCVKLFYPAVRLKTANPYPYHRTKLNISIPEFIAPFL